MTPRSPAPPTLALAALVSAGLLAAAYFVAARPEPAPWADDDAWCDPANPEDCGEPSARRTSRFRTSWDLDPANPPLRSGGLPGGGYRLLGAVSIPDDWY